MPDTDDWSAPASASDISALSLKIDTVISNTAPINNPLLNATAAMSGARALIHTASGREGVVLYNPSTTDTVFVGGAAVTIANGIALLPGGFHSWGLNGQSLYGITSGGAVTLQITYGPVT